MSRSGLWTRGCKGYQHAYMLLCALCDTTPILAVMPLKILRALAMFVCQGKSAWMLGSMRRTGYFTHVNSVEVMSGTTSSVSLKTSLVMYLVMSQCCAFPCFCH